MARLADKFANLLNWTLVLGLIALFVGLIGVRVVVGDVDDLSELSPSELRLAAIFGFVYGLSRIVLIGGVILRAGTFVWVKLTPTKPKTAQPVVIAEPAKQVDLV